MSLSCLFSAAFRYCSFVPLPFPYVLPCHFPFSSELSYSSFCSMSPFFFLFGVSSVFFPSLPFLLLVACPVPFPALSFLFSLSLFRVRFLLHELHLCFIRFFLLLVVFIVYHARSLSLLFADLFPLPCAFHFSEGLPLLSLIFFLIPHIFFSSVQL